MRVRFGGENVWSEFWSQWGIVRWGNDDRKICKSLRCQSDTILLAIKLIRGPEGPAAHVLHAGVDSNNRPGALVSGHIFPHIFSFKMFHLQGADHAHEGAGGQGAVLVLGPRHWHEHLRVFILRQSLHCNELIRDWNVGSRVIGIILGLSMSDGLTLDPRVPETMVTSFCQMLPDKTYSIPAPPGAWLGRDPSLPQI